jgi:hypothetical protein
MRIGGIDPTELPNEEVLVLPRGDKQIVFRARGLKDFNEFNKLCPEPLPQKMLTKDGAKYDFDDPNYKEAVIDRDRKLDAYVIVASLEPSAIEWDTVDLSKPSTWTSWESDLQNAGFSVAEIILIRRLVMAANSLDDEKLRQAREVFLRGTQEKSVG